MKKNINLFIFSVLVTLTFSMPQRILGADDPGRDNTGPIEQAHKVHTVTDQQIDALMYIYDHVDNPTPDIYDMFENYLENTRSGEIGSLIGIRTGVMDEDCAEYEQKRKALHEYEASLVGWLIMPWPDESRDPTLRTETGGERCLREGCEGACRFAQDPATMLGILLMFPVTVTVMAPVQAYAEYKHKEFKREAAAALKLAVSHELEQAFISRKLPDGQPHSRWAEYSFKKKV